MAVAKLTKSAVERLAPGQAIWDQALKGFGARRQKDGIYYYVRYRVIGVPCMKSLGRHGHLTPEEARKLAKAKLGLAASGLDPFDAEKKARASESFGIEAERFLAKRKAVMKLRGFDGIQRHLLKYAKPLHNVRLTDINRRTIAVLLGEIESDSGSVTRNRVRSSLSAFFNWAVREGLLDANPVTGTAKADEGRSRERVLTQEELALIWRNLGDDHFSNVVRLLILTAQRRNEIGHLRWSEVDFDNALLVLSPERTKNGRKHELPLAPQALAVLRKMLEDTSPTSPRPNDDFVFGKWSGWGWDEGKARLYSAVNANGSIAPWTLHDLRRTAATMMAEQGFAFPHVIEQILNHVSGHKGGVAGIYNRAKYLGGMREALGKWANYVDEIAL